MALIINETLVSSFQLDAQMAAKAAAGSHAIVTFAGRLDVRGGDSHVVLRINGARTGYQSL